MSNQLESIQNQYGSIPNRHGSIQNQDGSIPIHTLQNPSNQKKEKVYRDLVDRGYIEEDCELASRDSNTYAEALIKLREKYQIK